VDKKAVINLDDYITISTRVVPLSNKVVNIVTVLPSVEENLSKRLSDAIEGIGGVFDNSVNGYLLSDNIYDLYDAVESALNASAEDVQIKYSLIEDKDTRDGSMLYVLKFNKLLGRDEFSAVSNAIKELGGVYSKFKKGFIFKTQVTHEQIESVLSQSLNVKAAPGEPEIENDRESKTNELFNMLKEGVKKYTVDPEQFKQLLDFKSRFHNYSLGNILLILFQNPKASLVGSFRHWHDLGFPVKKGEKGLSIFVPAPVSYFEVTDADGSKRIKKLSQATQRERELIDSGQIEIKTVMKYKIGYVFDISQTTATEDDLPKLMVNNLKSDANLLYRLWPEVKNISPDVTSVSYDDLGLLGAKGYFNLDNKNIVLNSRNGELQDLKTLIHETAHSILHSDDTDNTSRQVEEIEAESVAYIVSQYYGYDTSDYSFAYLKNWGEEKSEDLLIDSFSRISNTANKIIEHMDRVIEAQNKMPEQQRLLKLLDTKKDILKMKIKAGNEDPDLVENYNQVQCDITAVQQARCREEVAAIVKSYAPDLERA